MRARDVFFRPITLAALLAGAAIAANACGGGGGASPSSPTNAAPSASGAASGGASVDADADATTATAASPGDGHWSCSGSAGYDACLERDRLREEVLDDLEDFELSRDKRNVPLAIEAMTSKDPLVVAAGMRILGQFPREPGVADAAMPYLLSSRPALQSLAAELLERGDDDAKGKLAKQWKKGHKGSFSDLTPYDRDPPRDPATWGWSAFQGATHYPPADSPTTLGYATTASPDAVVAFYTSTPGARTITEAEFKAMVNAPLDALSDQANALAAEYQRTHDPAVIKKMQELGKAISSSPALAAHDMPLPEGHVTPKFVVAESRASKATRIAVVYAEPTIGKTVFMLSWDPSAYTTSMPFAKPTRPKR